MVARELPSLSYFAMGTLVLERLISGIVCRHPYRARARLNSSNNSSLVVDSVCDKEDASDTAVACVYCDFYTQGEQSTARLLGALLKQVLSALESMPEEVKSAFVKSKRRVGGCRLLLPDILEMLAQSLRRFQRVFICLDALDEFPAKHRPELWESLRQIVRECPSARLFLTGRLHIRYEVHESFPGTAEMLPICLKEHDIELYLKMRLSRDPEPDALDEELETDILKIVPEVTSRRYVLP